MIFVTGAGGTIGSEVVRQLVESSAPFRAGFHSTPKTDAARDNGIDAVVLDLRDQESLIKAFTGISRLFLLGANVPDQARLEISAVEAAKKAGVRHVVKLSVADADSEDHAFAKIHREVERAIEACGLEWTFLRPNSFMQNMVTFQSSTIRSRSAFFTAAAGARISHVDIRDVAAVAVRSLTGTGHENKLYELNGPEALTFDEVASAISNAAGRTIAHINLSPEDLKRGMLSAGIPEPMADNLLDLQRHYRDGKAASTVSDIQTVTGREPTRFADFARDMAATGVWDPERPGEL